MYWLSCDKIAFPPIHLANKDGLLAIGGDLSPQRLLLAYQSGIFPWYSDKEPILWWSPNPRFVLFPNELKTSKSTKQLLRKNTFKFSFDTAFEEVIKACKSISRKNQNGTWINNEILFAYTQLHKMGYAHSVEVWDNDLLVGGIYGIALGKHFYGESMFSLKSNASKLGFIFLVNWLLSKEFTLIDCQIYSEYLESLGARQIPREHFLSLLSSNKYVQNNIGKWETP